MEPFRAPNIRPRHGGCAIACNREESRSASGVVNYELYFHENDSSRETNGVGRGERGVRMVGGTREPRRGASGVGTLLRRFQRAASSLAPRIVGRSGFLAAVPTCT